MCLENFKKITTEEDIIAYKLLERKFFTFYTEYVSPFYLFKWEIGKVYGEGHLEPLFGYGDEEYGQTINGGCFHTFKNLGEAQLQLQVHRDRWTLNTYIAKCRIPKDSNFIYEGEYKGATPAFGDKGKYICQGYASEKLEILEILAD
jgi:hypothetical protein